MMDNIRKNKTLLEYVSAEDKTRLYGKSSERVPFSVEMMKDAIEQGREVGVLFQSNNSKYKMPVSKYRLIQPVAMGRNSNGRMVIRVVHVFGQSEKEARRTGIRSAEAENEWRLLGADNIKGMWYTGRFYADSIPNYKSNDSMIVSQLASYDRNKAKSFQDQLVAQEKEDQVQVQPQEEPRQPDPNKLPLKERKKWVRSLFKTF
jgi:hypothetical protein